MRSPNGVAEGVVVAAACGVHDDSCRLRALVTGVRRCAAIVEARLTAQPPEPGKPETTLLQLETHVFEAERRIIPAISHFLDARRTLPPDDPRRKANRSGAAVAESSRGRRPVPGP